MGDFEYEGKTYVRVGSFLAGSSLAEFNDDFDMLANYDMIMTQEEIDSHRYDEEEYYSS